MAWGLSFAGPPVIRSRPGPAVGAGPGLFMSCCDVGRNFRLGSPTGRQGSTCRGGQKLPVRGGSDHCCDVARCESGFFVNGVGRARQGKGCWACDRCGLCPGTGDRWVLGNPPAPRGVSVAADPYPRALSEFGSLQCGLEAPALGGDRTISDEAYRVSRLLEIGTQRRSHISWPTGKAVLGDASAAPTGIIVA